MRLTTAIHICGVCIALILHIENVFSVQYVSVSDSETTPIHMTISFSHIIMSVDVSMLCLIFVSVFHIL
jgi:hypothetical protein